MKACLGATSVHLSIFFQVWYSTIITQFDVLFKGRPDLPRATIRVLNLVLTFCDERRVTVFCWTINVPLVNAKLRTAVQEN